ncbi:MAG: hypothetical protein SGJ18_14590 [Pseudomonadota bacterium]|nr:hypothetical protein [Pseudomonadota bacterium]
MKRFAILIILLAPLDSWSARQRMANVDRLSSKAALDGTEFRQKRRVAIGSSFGGAAGIAGINLDLNLTDQAALSLLFGVGDPFQSFGFAIKRFVSGTSFLPYFSAGYVRWTHKRAESQAIETTLPNILGKRFLNSGEKESGQFSEDIIYPGLGLQYVQLSGPWAGISMYLELQALVDVDDFQTATTGALGISYYF